MNSNKVSKVEKDLMLVSVAESFSDGGRSGDLMVISALKAKELRPWSFCKCHVTEVWVKPGPSVGDLLRGQ